MRRIGFFCAFDLLALPPGKAKDIPKKKAQEAENYHKQATGKIIALDARGKSFDSAGFADWLQKEKDRGHALSFCIGAADGLDETFKTEAYERLTLSPQTYTHDLARNMLLEQLYRALDMHKNGNFHK